MSGTKWIIASIIALDIGLTFSCLSVRSGAAPPEASGNVCKNSDCNNKILTSQSGDDKNNYTDGCTKTGSGANVTCSGTCYKCDGHSSGVYLCYTAESGHC